MHLYQPVTNLRDKGYSLIEFMIAIAISLIILLAVAIAWQSGFRTQQSQTDVSRLNETIRFSIDLLSREIKQAGLINTSSTNLVENNFCATTAVGSAIAGINDPATIDPTAAGMTLSGATVTVLNKSDAIRVRYYGEDATAGTGTASTEVSYDCLGNLVTAGALVEDTLYVAADPANHNEPALWCHTNNANAANPTLPMVNGVESMQILYGVDTDADGIINQYVPWQLIPTANQDLILSVKVSIVARSANPVSLDTTPKTFYHFGGAPTNTAGAIGSTSNYTDPTGGAPGTTFVAPNDRRLRLPPMSTEISIRNFGFCG